MALYSRSVNIPPSHKSLFPSWTRTNGSPSRSASLTLIARTSGHLGSSGSLPFFLVGAESLRVGTVSRLAKPSRKRRPQGGLDAVLASWTMGAEEDGPMRYPHCE
jgi:hypothetical protein